LAGLVSEEDLEKGSLYPPLNTIQKCSLKIATRVAEYAYKHGMLHESSYVRYGCGLSCKTTP
jgi:malate dehydrogenase (oxaloacetate-decarboxylating)(NADP+)